MTLPKKDRLDRILVERGLAKSRARAKEMVESRGISLDGHVLFDPSVLVQLDAPLTVMRADIPWVSRGALKLIAALDAWAIDPAEKVAVDIGSSTGGFTEVLLARGAKRVYAIDVGTDQLAPSLRSDPRVVSMEGTHILSDTIVFPEPIALVVVDVSFISVIKVIPIIERILAPKGEVIVLVKPQFEVGRKGLGKGGVVRDDTLREEALKRVSAAFTSVHFTVSGTMDSPISGGHGNREYLLHAKK